MSFFWSLDVLLHVLSDVLLDVFLDVFLGVYEGGKKTTFCGRDFSTCMYNL